MVGKRKKDKMMPVRQKCPKCGRSFMGSDCIGRPCMDCRMAEKMNDLAKAMGMHEDAVPLEVGKRKKELEEQNRIDKIIDVLKNDES